MSNVLKRPTEAMHGTLISADFPDDTITLEMEPGYYTAKMRFAVVPADEYIRQCEQRAELLEALSGLPDKWNERATICRQIAGDTSSLAFIAADSLDELAAELRAAIANATQQRNATGGEG